MAKLFSHRLFQIVVIAFVAYASVHAFRLWKNRNDGFTLDRIYTNLPNSPTWEFPENRQKIPEVNQILAQPFNYLGRGFQFYAFVSSDGKYVLKFMRHQRLAAPVFYSKLPNWPILRDLKAKKSKKRADRVDSLFNSLKIAYEKVPVQTGLVYVHLNKTKNDHPKAYLVDFMGDAHEVALDKTEFLLQKKATFVKPTIKALMQAGRLQDAKDRINQIFELLRECAAKGVLDADGALISKNNIGFIEGRAILIDAGKLVMRDNIKTKERYAQDLKRLRPLYKWLVAHYPPLAAHFEKQQKKVLASYHEE